MVRGTSNKMRIRLNVVMFCMVFLATGILVSRLFYIQIYQGEFWQGKAISQQMRATQISAERGTIYDTNMKTLAASATVWDVIVSPAQIDKPEELEMIADYLSELLDVDRDKVIERGQRTKSYYEVIKSKVEKDVADEISKFILEKRIDSINLVENTRRYYPYGSLASTVLGFTGSDNNGAYGLESYYNKTLSGVPGMRTSAKNAKGADMNYLYEQLFEAQPGNSIVLTIDEAVQHFVEKHLENAVVEHNVQERACAIVMDVKTGAILAMATKPDFDPNEPLVIADPSTVAALEALRAQVDDEAYRAVLGEAQFDQWRNKAISDPYEPGSVFKILTAAMALDLDVADPQASYYTCPGYHIVAGRRKACWKGAGHGTINFTEAVKFSCNPAFMMIGERVGPKNFYTYFDRFGLLDVTGVGLPGEAGSIFYDIGTLSKTSGEELASSAFGQTFKITPIQLVTAVSSVVNGGNLMEPYVVKQVIDAEGNIIETTEPTVRRQVISAETSATMSAILQKVVGDPDGSGRYAYVAGYRVGGKTGTSEKIDKSVDGIVNHRISSFLGVAPCDDPQYVVLVMMDEPHLENVYGSIIAAPVVGAIFEDILPYLGVEPHYTEKELANIDISTPQVVGTLAADAKRQIESKSLSCRIVGEGDTVIRQVPGSGQPIPRGSRVILYTEEENQSTTVMVPSVIGYSGARANEAIINAGLNIKVGGISIDSVGSEAYSQSPVAGTVVEAGTVVTVLFTSNTPEAN